jgi:hypothetical protein
MDDLRERIAMLLDGGPTLHGSDLEARTMRGAVSGWIQAIGRVLEMIPEHPEAALQGAEARIARLETLARTVADGPVMGEFMEPWIRDRMQEARAALSPREGEGT